MQLQQAGRIAAKKVSALGFTKAGKKMSPAQGQEVAAALAGFRNAHVARANIANTNDDPPALTHQAEEASNDYILNPGQNSVWITVGNLSVYVRRNDEGVSVDLYPKGKEMEDSIAGTWATFNEGLTDYLVAYGPHVIGSGEDILLFNCQADDADHAREQAENAYPDDKVYGAAENGDVPGDWIADLAGQVEAALGKKIAEEFAACICTRCGRPTNMGDGLCDQCVNEDTANAIDRHSITCCRCGEMADERNCVPNTAEHGGNDDGGEICPKCIDPEVEVMLPNGKEATWHISQNLTDRWGDINVSEIGKAEEALHHLANTNELLEKWRGQMWDELTFVVRKDGQYGILYEAEYCSRESESDSNDIDYLDSLPETTKEARGDLAEAILELKLQERFPQVQFCIPDEAEIINDRPAVWAFTAAELTKEQREELGKALLDL